jgi:hypothetical protein
VEKLKCIGKKSNKPYCKKKKQFIEFKDCSNCKKKDYKEVKIYKLKQNKPIKKYTYKHAKADKERFSIMVNDMSICAESNKKYDRADLNYHEIFYGNGKRQLSIKYGLVIPLYWRKYHNQFESKGIHFDKQMCLKWQIKGQLEAMKYYNWSEDEFREIFGKSYLNM